MATATGAEESDLEPAERARWWTVTWRALRRFDSDQMTHHAAAMTYYVMLSLFPALILGVALLGTFGRQGTVEEVVSYLRDNGAPASILEPVDAVLRNAVRSSGQAISVALVLSLALAVYGASGAFAASRRALNVAFGVQETRTFVRRKLGDFAATLLLVFFAVLAIVLVFLGGSLADDLFATLGLGDTAAAVWQVARWPAAFLVVLVAFAFVYENAPDVTPRRFRPFTPGGIIAVALWIAASVGFFVYVGKLGSLAVFGPFTAAIVLLLWIWLTNVALLLGAEINFARGESRSAGRGGPPAITPPPGAR